MSSQIRISPAGRLVFDHDQPGPVGKLTPESAERLADAFAESSASGLALLATDDYARELPPDLVYWRHFSQRFFQTLCHQGEGAIEDWEKMTPPERESLQALVDSAPPMPGLEYLTTETLRSLWRELRTLVVERARQIPGGAEAYLRSVNPVLHLLGRVTLHLAENKKDPEHPFAFLATYTNRLSEDAKLQHLPLGKAIQQYVGENDHAALMSLLAPVQRAARKVPLLREMLDTKAIFQPQSWTVSQAYRLLQAVPELEESGLVLRVPDWWRKGKARRAVVQVHVGTKSTHQVGAETLLDFSVNLALDEESLTADEVRQILDAAHELVLLRGQWVEVDRQRLQQALDHWERLSADHPDGISFLEGMRLLAGVDMGADARADKEAAREWSMVTAGKWLQDTLRQIRDPRESEKYRPGKQLNAQLRPYQEHGVRWLWLLNRLGIGGCLADDMGLGKTIQIIALLLLIREQSRGQTNKPSLLVVPASLIGNWKGEIQRFCPSLNAFYAHRSETSAEDLSDVAADPLKALQEYDVVLTTYGLARRLSWPARVNWRLVVLDEAQAIKNPGSTQTKAVKQLKSENRFVLTGTPVENQLGDLWSLFDFCCPGLLGSASQFKTYVNRLQKRQTQGAFAPLRRLVRPYILRRLKTDPDVAPDLPDKTEMRCDCALTKKQAVLYTRAVEDFRHKLQHATGMARRGLVLSALMQFKQICNHPAQFLGQPEFHADDSGKMKRLAQLCEPIVERQEKMLVFTQFRALTEPLASFLSGVFRRPGVVLHGGTSVAKRKGLVADFQSDQGPPFFVISLKAGGTGLNLTAAAHVVHFDRWWNPAVENQATDRAFRIGQTKNVLVHKFVCRGTVEEKIDGMIADKQQLARQILDEGAELALTEMNDQQLVELVTLDLQRATASE